MKIREKELAVIQEALDRYFRSQGLFGKCKYLAFANGATIPVRSIVFPKLFLRAVRFSIRFGLPGLVTLPRARSELLIKNNIRVIYAESNGNKQTAKIGLRSASRSGSLAREIKARKLLTRAAGQAAIPKLLDYDRESLHWIKEEFVSENRQVSRVKKADAFLRDVAVSWYGKYARPGSVGKFLRRHQLGFEELRNILSGAGVNVEPSAEACTWPVSFTHGDLSPGNMMARHGGGTAVVDWELFSCGPVAYDLKGMFKLNPQATLQMLRTLSGPHDLDVFAQMQFALAIQVLVMQRDRQKSVDYYRDQLGLDTSAAERRIDDNIAAAISAITSLNATLASN